MLAPFREKPRTAATVRGSGNDRLGRQIVSTRYNAASAAVYNVDVTAAAALTCCARCPRTFADGVRVMNARARMTKKYTGPVYMKLEYQMLEHPAFATLSGNAFKLLIYARKRFDGTNNGEIIFGVREAADLLRCSKDTASRAFQELIEHRVLEPVVKGAFSVKIRKATTWRITFIHMNGRAGTNDYLHFKPPSDGPMTGTEATAPNLEHGPRGAANGPSGRTERSFSSDHPRSRSDYEDTNAMIDASTVRPRGHLYFIAMGTTFKAQAPRTLRPPSRPSGAASLSPLKSRQRSRCNPAKQQRSDPFCLHHYAPRGEGFRGRSAALSEPGSHPRGDLAAPHWRIPPHQLEHKTMTDPDKKPRARRRPLLNRAARSAKALATIGFDPATVDPVLILKSLAADSSLPAAARVQACKAIIALQGGVLAPATARSVTSGAGARWRSWRARGNQRTDD